MKQKIFKRKNFVKVIVHLIVISKVLDYRNQKRKFIINIFANQKNRKALQPKKKLWKIKRKAPLEKNLNLYQIINSNYKITKNY